MRNIIYLATTTLAFTLAACNGPQDTTTPVETVGMRITAEVPAGIKADRFTILPNDIAPWLSQILILSDGRLYQTSANGGKAQSVDSTGLKDIIGLMRKGKAGTALTLTKDGKLAALIEKDDEGRLALMNLSAKAESFEGFCQNTKAPEARVTAFTGKYLVTFEITYEGDNLITIIESDRTALPKSITSCHVSGKETYAVANDKLYRNGDEIAPLPSTTENLTSVSNKPEPIFLLNQSGEVLSTFGTSQPDKRRKVTIEDGLSVLGTQNISAVLATADNLGGTFSEGAIIAQDAEADRLVLIALPFAKRTLAE